MSEIFHRWHHSPAHVFLPNMMYMVTASTLYKQHRFLGDERLYILHDALMEVTEYYGWLLQAWAILSNHYHFIAKSPDNADTLKTMIQRLHSQTARIINRLDETAGRQVWFQYWDTCLTYEKSYYARLNYVHNNPIKHGLVDVAEQYPFCSAKWFNENAEPEFIMKIKQSPYDKIDIVDDF